MSAIKHLVVLMLENRSFDHMLGFLKSAAYPINGVDGTQSNSDSKGVATAVTPTADFAGDYAKDPGHDHLDVLDQMSGGMAGFVRNYEKLTKNAAKGARIMKCFSPAKVPIITRLAQEYAICDNWFSSLPGPTLPNRAFAHSGTSAGRLDMSPLWLNQPKTVYELLRENGHEARIYMHDFSIAMTYKRLMNDQHKYFGQIDDFFRACKKDKLPAYSFIEPRYFSSPGLGANDQHPDHDVSLGETLIEDVYKAIAGNKAVWESTLFCICYDEHGGLYDHVPPPATVNPDGINCTKPPFDFKQFGVRTPGILVSPLIKQGTIDSTLYDHTSVIATARKVFLPNPAAQFLTERDRNANSFEGVLTLTAARPPIANLRGMTLVAPRKPHDSSKKKLSKLQRGNVRQMQAIEKTLPRKTRYQPDKIKTEAQAAAYIKAVLTLMTAKKKGKH